MVPGSLEKLLDRGLLSCLYLLLGLSFGFLDIPLHVLQMACAEYLPVGLRGR